MKLLCRRGAVGFGERAHGWELREAHAAAAGMALCSVVTADTSSTSLPSSRRFLMYLGIKSCILLSLALLETAPKEDIFHWFEW